MQELDDADGFDLVWLPSFFIPESVLDEAIAKIYAVMRPGATLVLGIRQGGEEDSLASVADHLFTLRSGGSVIDPEDALARLQRVGFGDTREVERTWDAPLRLVIGPRG